MLNFGEERQLLREVEKRRCSTASMVLATVVVMVGALALVSRSTSVNSSTAASVERSHVAVTAVADVIGPDLLASNAQKLVYENNKILATGHKKSKEIWLGVYDQFKQSAAGAQDLPHNTYLALVAAQVAFHVAATAENVHLFISDAAYGLMISYKVKVGWLASKTQVQAYNQVSTEERQHLEELKRLVSVWKGSFGQTVHADAANPDLAKIKEAAANAAKAEYQRLQAQGNAERKAWLDDLAARNSAQSMTLAEHLHSIALFTKYKITKTAELVQEYAWLINYTEYLRWKFGHTFVVDLEAPKQLGKRMDELMETLGALGDE